MKVYIYVAITLFFLTPSCKTKIDNDEYKIIKVEDQHWEISEYFNIARIVALETKKECYITRIDKLIMRNGNYYILDRNLKSLFLFDHKGMFINKVNSIGKGPSEFLSIASIDINDEGVFILVWQGHQKIMKYDFNLDFVSETMLSVSANSFSIHKDTISLYAGNIKNKAFFNKGTPHNFGIIDYNGNILYTALPFDKSYLSSHENFGGNSGCYFSKSRSGDVFFTKPYNNYIYKIENNRLKKSMRIDFNYQSIDDAQFNYKKDEINRFYKGNKVKSIHNLYVLENKILYETFSNKQYNRCIILGDKALSVNDSGIDPKFGVNLSFKVGYTEDNDGIICSLSPKHIMTRADRYFLDKKILNLREGLSANDNPILISLVSK